MKKKWLIAALGIIISIMNLQAQTDELYSGFKTPSKEFYPRVWWHWMHGNVTKDGIKKDLEWMERSGIAGFHHFNAQLNPTDVIVQKRVKLFSEEWKECFSYALDIADSLNLEVSIASSPGWSITGGPWVKEDFAQKKICWQTKDIEGGKKIKCPLPSPIIYSGPFQEKPQWPKDIYRFKYYKDIAVLAIRTEAIEKNDTIILWKNKVGFEVNNYIDSHSPASADKGNHLKSRDIIDITEYCRNDSLNWKAPKGKWTIYRFGYNLLGRVNGPVEKAGVGLEADKLSREAMERYYRDYLSIIDEASGNRLGKVIKYMTIDSYEAGKGTWTPLMIQEFKKRRGYDIIKWLPVLTGLSVESTEKSEGFLADWRKTLGELIIENHYDLAAQILHEYGMELNAESHESNTGFIGDGIEAKKHASTPMGALWVRYNEGWYSADNQGIADIRESASAAHIYGGNICGAESFSVNSRPSVKGHFPAYQCSPKNLKKLADDAMSQGLNRFILHCSPHQPTDNMIPGLGLGSFGNWFTRHDTWSEEARSWHDYLARSCYMLQQGKYIADIALLYNEDSNITASFKRRPIPVPINYGFDLINTDILTNVLKNENGFLKSASGMEYRLLMIDEEYRYMSVPVLKKLLEFAENGILICGKRPKGKLLLSDSQKEFDSLVKKIWDKERKNVSESLSPETMLKNHGIIPDVEFIAPMGCKLQYQHRRTSDADIYYITNTSQTACEVMARFRTEGMKPVRWNAEDGSINELSYIPEGMTTKVKMRFDEDDAYFIVFRGVCPKKGMTLEEKKECGSITIEGPWEISFQKGRGAPEKTTFDSCKSYTESNEEGIRYFSGTALWRTDFNLEISDNTEYILNLGQVEVMARVKINGNDLGLLWKSPYRIDISKYLISGQNRLEIAITNLWPNRMIGDSFKPKSERITYTPWQFYTPEYKPIPSGLIGPVTITKYR